MIRSNVSIQFANSIEMYGYEIFADAAKASDGIPTRSIETVLVYAFVRSRSLEKSSANICMAKLSHMDDSAVSGDVSADDDDKNCLVDASTVVEPIRRRILRSLIQNDSTLSQRDIKTNETVTLYDLSFIISFRTSLVLGVL